MDILPEDKQVVDLLNKLKSTRGDGYPSDLLSARRNQYIRQVANVGLGIGLGMGLKHAINGSGGSSSAGTAAVITNKILEAALITAIAIEAGTVAYIYRDKITDAVRSLTGAPTAQVTTPLESPASETANQNELQTIFTPLTASTLTSETASSTPAPVSTGSAANSNNNTDNSAGSSNGNGINATAVPSDNNGNQYGLTPKPERTKENDGGENGNSDGGNKKDK